MSTLKVDAIRHNSATSDAITTAADGTCTAKLTSINGGSQLSHRNIIINGAMTVAQRASSTTSNGYGFVDRFQTNVASLSTGGNVTRSQQSLSSSDTGPWQAGFRKYARMATVGAGTASAGSTIDFYTHIEAQDMANSGWDYTSASGKITLSFWFRCSANQTFYTYVRSRDGTQQGYTFAFTASGNNTWTKITHTLPGNSNITFDDNNGAGLSIYWIPYYGTTYTNNKTLNTWAEHSGSNTSPDMQSTWLTSGAATWDITGIQLEVGDTATSFEHRSYCEELARCQRYFYRHGDLNTTRNYALMGNGMIGHNGSTDTGKIEIVAPVRMRQQPTVSVIGTDSFIIHTGGGETGTSDAIGTLASGGLWTSASSDINFWIDIGRTSGGSPSRGVACIVYANNNGANLGFSAEL